VNLAVVTPAVSVVVVAVVPLKKTATNLA